MYENGSHTRFRYLFIDDKLEIWFPTFDIQSIIYLNNILLYLNAIYSIPSDS